jgi:hypothetical protein
LRRESVRIPPEKRITDRLTGDVETIDDADDEDKDDKDEKDDNGFAF